LQDDIEEMKDLYHEDAGIASLLREELLDTFEANRQLS
jgi:hypothetical protein